MSDGIAAAGWHGVTWRFPVETSGSPAVPPAAPGLEASTLGRYPAGPAAAPPGALPESGASDTHRVAFQALLDRVQVAVQGPGGWARASAEAHAQGSAEVRLGPGSVAAEASVALGATAAVSAALAGACYALRGEARVSAELLARAFASASATARGVAASAGAEVRASLRAEAEADLRLGGGLVAGHASGSAEAGGGARARASVGLSSEPPRASLELAAGAFSGARAAFDARAGVLGLTVGVHGEAWAGVGVQAELAVGLHDGKFSISLGLGVAVGVGGFLRIELEIDFRAIGRALSDFFSHLFGGAPAAPALDTLGEVLGRLAPGTAGQASPVGEPGEDAEATPASEAPGGPEAALA